MQRYIQARTSTRRKILVNTFSGGMAANKDERVLPPNIAKKVYNFDFSRGSLEEGYGLEKVHYITRSVKNIWTYKRYDFDTEKDQEVLMYSDFDGYVYYLLDYTEYQLDGVQFTSTPYAVNYRLFGDDVILMGSSTDNLTVWDFEHPAYKVDNSPHMTSMVVHFERMFCTVGGERNAVWFSQDLDPTNWDLQLDRGGFIQMLDERGKLNKVISFSNFVYILRDFGISRLTAFASQEEFSTSNLFVSSGKIYANTASLCGDRIIFLASDGLYQFDGLSTNRIMQRLDGVLKPSPNSSACFHNGKYYLSFRLEDEDDANTVNNAVVGSSGGVDDNNAVLVYEVQTGGFSLIKGVSVRTFSKRGEKLYAITADGIATAVNKCGKIFDEPTQKIWSSGYLDFNIEGRKHIREIYLSTDYPIRLKVYSERGEKEFEVTPIAGVNRIRVNLSGRKIGVDIVAETAKARVTRPTIVFT